MLRRARRRAQKRGLTSVEFVRADATGIPLPDDSAELFLSYWGLHCFADPEAAIAEASRVLKPTGRMVGATFLKGEDSRRQKALIRANTGDFGRVATEVEILAWITAAGFELGRTERSGPMLFFEATVT
jgi:ubiquinone/menaquinone biosynthesis C-methylase UbiE